VTGQHGPGCRLPEACQSLEQPRARSTLMEASGEPAGRGRAEVGAGSFSTWLLTGRRGRSDARRAPSRPRTRRSRRAAAHRPAGNAAKPWRTWSATPERFRFRGNKTTRGDLEGVCALTLFVFISQSQPSRCNVSSIARAQRHRWCAQDESGIVGGAGGAGRAGSGLACRAHGQPALRGRARRPASRPHAGLRHLRRPRAAAPQLRSQCPSHARVPPQGAPGGSGQLSTPMKRLAHWAPSHCPRCSSPPKPPIDFTAFDHAGTA